MQISTLNILQFFLPETDDFAPIADQKGPPSHSRRGTGTLNLSCTKKAVALRRATTIDGRHHLQMSSIAVTPSNATAPRTFVNYSVSSGITTSMESSFSCFSSTVPGALIMRSDASFTFGNAMTSRIESEPVKIIAIRSRP